MFQTTSLLQICQIFRFFFCWILYLSNAGVTGVPSAVPFGVWGGSSEALDSANQPQYTDRMNWMMSRIRILYWSLRKVFLAFLVPTTTTWKISLTFVDKYIELIYSHRQIDRQTEGQTDRNDCKISAIQLWTAEYCIGAIYCLAVHIISLETENY